MSEKILSVFIDESGDFGPYEAHAPYYLVSMILQNSYLCPFLRLNGRILLLRDGTKVPKEARRMPGVKKLYQESEDSSKPGVIHGHMFGGIGAAKRKSF